MGFAIISKYLDSTHVKHYRIVEQVPMKRFGIPDEIAKTVLFLSNSDFTYILGVEIAVDRGFSQI
ncbi:SDR family oxidoreductase (plasmid) [Pseudanabaena biceps]|nr:SDR family oxidoreductase [Pseudanabaena biceps]